MRNVIGAVASSALVGSLVAVLAPFATPAAQAAGCDTSSSAGTSFTVLSYNVLGPESDVDDKRPAGLRWAHRRNAVAATICQANADVVGLQETTTKQGYNAAQDMAKRLSGYKAFIPSGQGSRQPIFYKGSRFVAVNGGTRKLSDWSKACQSNRWMTWVVLSDKKNNRRTTVVNVHMPVVGNGSDTGRGCLKEKKQASKKIAKVLNDMDTWVPNDAIHGRIVLGDFNTQPASCSDKSDPLDNLINGTGYTLAPDANWYGKNLCRPYGTYNAQWGKKVGANSNLSFTGTGDKRLDHILVGTAGIYQGTRTVFPGKTLSLKVDGKVRKVTPSDHQGIRVTVAYG